MPFDAMPDEPYWQPVEEPEPRIAVAPALVMITAAAFAPLMVVAIVWWLL